MSTPNAPATRHDQFQFLRDAHHGPLTWHALCLSLARKAPGLPPVYPSARAAMEATPRKRRHPLIKATRGMVAYFSDPNDSNPYDHITTVAMWDGCRACLSHDDAVFYDDSAHKHSGDLSDLLVWSNDAVRDGGVDMVRASFFPTTWGDPFTFASDWLNGFDLPGYDIDKPILAPDRGPTLGANFDHAIADVRRALRYHREKGHKAIVAALARDLARMKAHRATFS